LAGPAMADKLLSYTKNSFGSVAHVVE
jgi:hypothetical protein